MDRVTGTQVSFRNAGNVTVDDRVKRTWAEVQQDRQSFKNIDRGTGRLTGLKEREQNYRNVL
jgi:hypothetical protein